jgi:hypothetical protein
MAVTTTSPAPYGPSSAVADILERYRNRGMSTPFTREVLTRAGVTDSLVPRVLHTLQALELIDDELRPTETLEALRRAPETELKAQMAAWIRRVYADVFNFVEPTDDETKIRDAFRHYNPVGQQSRMIALFIGLCRAAGLRPDDVVQESRPRPAARKPAVSTGISGGMSLPRTLRALAEVQRSPPGLPPALAGLLQSLPSTREWTKQERDKFMKTFEAVLDFSIAVVAVKTKSTEGEDDA